jgi:hypothetical protein
MDTKCIEYYLKSTILKVFDSLQIYNRVVFLWDFVEK